MDSNKKTLKSNKSFFNRISKFVTTPFKSLNKKSKSKKKSKSNETLSKRISNFVSSRKNRRSPPIHSNSNEFTKKESQINDDVTVYNFVGSELEKNKKSEDLNVNDIYLVENESEKDNSSEIKEPHSNNTVLNENDNEISQDQTEESQIIQQLPNRFTNDNFLMHFNDGDFKDNNIKNIYLTDEVTFLNLVIIFTYFPYLEKLNLTYVTSDILESIISFFGLIGNVKKDRLKHVQRVILQDEQINDTDANFLFENQKNVNKALNTINLPLEINLKNLTNLEIVRSDFQQIPDELVSQLTVIKKIKIKNQTILDR